ncbi:MAG: hypothetical protein HY056_10465 [Proteobacteria bacterium]|nr:hypothetical protein [Pseudomonadota bacterium]
MADGGWLVLFLLAQRLGELVLARRNTARLRAAGAIEHGRGHYPCIVALHAAWLAGLWLLGRDQEADRWLLAVFVLLQAARAWVIASLGARWTTRVIVLADAPLVRHGPYRLLRHPNYAIVAAEIAVVPLMLGLPEFAAVFFLLNAALLAWRIRVETTALAAARMIDAR